MEVKENETRGGYVYKEVCTIPWYARLFYFLFGWPMNDDEIDKLIEKKKIIDN